MTSDQAKTFSKLFAGLSRSSGRYVVPDGAKPGPDGKVMGRAWTSHEPITMELWEAHLSGRKATVKDEETNAPITGALGLGVVPICEDGMCVFGAIDVDVYPLDLNALLARVRKLGLPLVLVRSKSGGAHLYLFLTAPAKAELVRERLAEWSVALNHPGVEIFPKQALLSQHSDGSWINIPYSGGARSVRYALKDDGTAMTVDEFLAEAERRAATPAELDAFEVEVEEDASGDWLEAPPCLPTLARVGFGEWGNNGLFSVAVYLRLRYPEGWEAKLHIYNERYIDPPVGHRDLTSMIKSIKKKSYFYKCKDQPISAVCNRSVCLKRRHGVGSGGGDSGVVFGEMTKVETDPVIWIWSIDGFEIELTTLDLVDQRRFKVVVIEKLSKVPNPVKPDEWTRIVRERMAEAKTLKAPEDGTREGQFWEHLANFCTARARARTLDEVLMGKAFTDVAGGRAYFRSTDFFSYLAAHRFSVTEREGWRFLRHGKAEHERKSLKGKVINLWSVPAFAEQTEAHDVPRGTPKVEM